MSDPQPVKARPPVATDGAGTGAPPVPSPRDARRVMLHMPVDVRGLSLAVIATLLFLYALQWSRDVMAPILSGVILSYALAPVVSRLQRLRVPRALGASVLLCVIVGMLAWGASALGGQVDALIDTVPAVTQRVREISQRIAGRESTLERVRVAADDLTAAAGVAASTSAASGVPAAPRAAPSRQPAGRPPPATAAEHAIDVRGYLVTGTLGAASFLTKLSIVLLTALFILASGSSFRRKMVKLAGRSFTQKKLTVETLDEITYQIQRYLLVQVGVSVAVGVCTGCAFMLLGLSNAGAWGLAAGLTNLVPYVGAAVLSGAAAIVALVQFGTLEMALAAGGVALIIHAVAGNVLAPWWTGRASKMSPVAVFVAVLVFGWLWGVWGLLLGVPILLVVKSVCDHVDDLKPVGELLGP
ncbi:AI-2E family transporter [Roseateles sp.]|uniref:AI-2E family transporter n=1 Tax=Roseateles sp. TaxID=1971397 RepID=UPI0025D9366D|nr:AI-2E family transporter [Roseateles sp.]MBV8037303.1 AI-2E family transporter [Roseateles sp.]